MKRLPDPPADDTECEDAWEWFDCRTDQERGELLSDFFSLGRNQAHAVAFYAQLLKQAFRSDCERRNEP